MADAPEVLCRPVRRRALWWFAAFGAAGAGLAAVGARYGHGPLAVWITVGLSLALLSVLCAYAATSRVGADEYGVHSRTLLRRRDMAWPDIADLRTYLQYGRNQEIRRVSVLLRDGHTRRLPLPMSGTSGDRAEFDAKLAALRALHRRHGDPESDHVPVITDRAAGHSTAVLWLVCVLLLAGAGLAASFVPSVGAEKRAWTAAVPCTAATPATERGECLSTQHAVIARTKISRGNQRSWLYFADGRPLERLGVSQDGAAGFHPGDRVELTVWRHRVRAVATNDHVWRDHFTGAGDVAVVAAGCALAAGYPGARLLLRRRGRRLPDDDVLPSALPFAAALVGTALWLMPLCYLRPTEPLDSPVTLTWAAAGTAVSLGMFTAAWRATRIRTPGDTPPTTTLEQADHFLAARFLDHTDYNPHGFGTHIVLGDGPPAVTPHPGPGRFAARRIPAERLTVTRVRRARGSDGDSVPRGWHIAELDDAGEPVRLAAAPEDLTRIIDALGCVRPAPDAERARP
ncbi:PH domain-containing protein [Streptomyces sp. NBC_01257]|uniref:PH domain-containing protein n=1 Tax=Streptomyces sp. NBC_01257 TaxID=2903799 RepID=UPI002DD7C9A7|nr:PH domain-containing protein [Streptomyces sp. NBC_01257]WRZ66732.1 PH domain-containing protein [Streptomyces sp. NBC_01257]